LDLKVERVTRAGAMPQESKKREEGNNTTAAELVSRSHAIGETFRKKTIDLTMKNTDINQGVKD